jgi:murein L,D-transpeptidase YcbB/YkuD
VALLRRRLLGGENTGQTPAAVAAGATPVTNIVASTNVYDPRLVAAVKSFQNDLGLRPTGIVSGTTLAELNVPIQARINQVILNMERWRWLPKKFEPDYLLVNIPEYRLRVFEQGKQALTMRVIVGKTLTATPIFSDKMEYVVLSPYWNVPFSIIDKELRPKLAADPQGTLDRLDMEVVKGYGRKATIIDPTTIDWANLTPETFKYTLRRRPGPKNDLGEVKFIFPNSNDIYLHDTPHNELFSETKRNFSHGCVRVEQPVQLATYLLRDNPNWDQTAIQDTIAERKEKYVTLKEKLPVYLVYLTAWADADGHPHFRDDIYGHDKALAKEYFN